MAVLLASTGCDRARLLTGKYLQKAVESTPAAPEPVIESVTDRSMEEFAQQRGKVVIIEYHATWSGQSLQIAPLVESLARESRGKVAIGKVDIEKFRSLADRESVKTIPDLRIYCDGRFVEKLVGLPDANELRKKLAGHVARIPAPSAAMGLTSSGAPVGQPMKKDWMPQGMSRR